MRASPTLRTPGSSGAARSCCRTHRCIRWPKWGRARFGAAAAPAERRLADLESTLAQVKLDPAALVSLIAPLLDIPLPPERAPELSGEELRRRQLAALTNWVM